MCGRGGVAGFLCRGFPVVHNVHRYRLESYPPMQDNHSVTPFLYQIRRYYS